eukprot:CAMPEP_0173380582 /NCGR_PEP_ID=MMETSP1356-20130122/3249_1 /TAXON_ID=77927 ORGANISM="Hemiselmis virescens, Strain PCC157" /NCGR_SAMPLE_ID=MMETSP1356 /ASSEMBLY_ACC=CAM_ASM_000847 /LENGTH=244 /DNA_ID=CAMNT_0014334233 /DNA_START=66 /DNA_END=800 /DNA_ORIENTATION=+
MLRLGLIVLLAAAAHAQTGDSTCLTNPNREMCKNAEDFYPKTEVASDLGKLCMMMGHMPGCSIKACCDDSSCASSIGAKYCEPWSLIKNICGTQSGEMMTGMAGCATFVKLCGADVSTMVAQCTEASSSPVASLPSTLSSLTNAVTVCGANAPATSQWCTDFPCTTTDAPNCKDPFNTISQACIKDSAVDACTTSQWKAMCDKDGANLQKFCGTSMTTTGGASRICASLLGFMLTAFALIASRR